MPSKIIGIAGSLSRPSKTRALVEAAVTRAAARFDLDGAVFDLSDIGPSLGQAGKLAELSEFSRAAVETILSADALVIASPVCKGGYPWMT
ncbi:MAG: NAD(P)H-dependent oxidoreductase [Cypionkella sp.]|uniref:NADPH-dependent FMN reductase n=1 Tax=Cypionkella sp. TaxID=2811411 RepID=UPI0027158C02|nr:NAD(P)H-dependent oxidoreductase [Cypionkella sp.]MDO8327598.1 NAD(P)H-dependent oxidoreductase [Cypionkella sp.]